MLSILVWSSNRRRPSSRPFADRPALPWYAAVSDRVCSTADRPLVCGPVALVAFGDRSVGLRYQDNRSWFRGVDRARSSAAVPLRSFSRCRWPGWRAPPRSARRDCAAAATGGKPAGPDVRDAVALGVGAPGRGVEGQVDAEAVGRREPRPLADQHRSQGGAEQRRRSRRRAPRAHLPPATIGPSLSARRRDMRQQTPRPMAGACAATPSPTGRRRS